VRQLAAHANRADPAVRAQAGLGGGDVDVPHAHARDDAGGRANLVGGKAPMIADHDLAHGEVWVMVDGVAHGRPRHHGEPERERRGEADTEHAAERREGRAGATATIPSSEDATYQLPTS
jgi:hypothetical protein